MKFKKTYRSLFIFKKKVAVRFSNVNYYKAQSKNMRQYVYLQSEKVRLSTPRSERITELLEIYKEKGATTQSKAGRILIGIYERNKAFIKDGIPPGKHSRLLQLVARPEVLVLAYRYIRGNKGAMTRGGLKSKEDVAEMTPLQKSTYFRSNIFPDGFSMRHIFATSKLLLLGQYPWGASKRVYFDKPGDPSKKRPITIPPFLDKVVQKAIDMVLHAIYEPSFDSLNRSFGFRPNKAPHDAMAALLSWKNNGMRTAIEGDIQGAYDNVNKQILLEILSKRISDRRFMALLAARLDYEYVDSETGQRVKPVLGIPQGGIDSPYLFNIYMSELDNFVHTEVQAYIDSLNIRRKVKPDSRKLLKATNSIIAATRKEGRVQKDILTLITQKSKGPAPVAKGTSARPTPRQKKLAHLDVEALREKLYHSVADKRRLRHKKRSMETTERNHQVLRIFFVRYADDWILLTNGDRQLGERIKGMITAFLRDKLGATLSDKKTLITEIMKEPAHFLGFELMAFKQGRLLSNPGGVGARRSTGQGIRLAPDRQRLISRLHMKGFCDETGFPLTMSWLATLEPHTIIERYNACILGMVQYHAGFVRDSAMNRWVYIMRYSCFKTLAQKYKCSIKKIFERFGVNQERRDTNTVSVAVRLVTEKAGIKKTYLKHWTLVTFGEVMDRAKASDRLFKVSEAFNARESGIIGEYPVRPGSLPAISNEGYLNTITWVSCRTEASLDTPCSVCGSSEDVEMHHIRAIRKQAYTMIPQNMTWKQVLALRNRKQLPVCKCCHDDIHRGRYRGIKLTSLISVRTLTDNRIVHVESFVKPGQEHYSKNLEERGWTVESDGAL